MNTRVPLAAFAFGCASSGGGDDPPPVQVYAATDELPCEYEVIQTVSGSSSRSTGGSQSRYVSIRADILGRAGADVGADAVIAAELPVGTQRRGVSRSGDLPPPPPRISYSGEAIRFIPGTCS